MLSKKPIVKAPPPRHLVYRPPSGSLKKRRRRRPKTPVIRPTDESTEGICESNSRTVTPEGIQCSTSNIVQQLCRDDLTTFTTTSGRAAEEAHIPFVKVSEKDNDFQWRIQDCKKMREGILDFLGKFRPKSLIRGHHLCLAKNMMRARCTPWSWIRD